MEISIRPAEIYDAESITELAIQLGYQANNRLTQNRLNEIIKNDRIVFWYNSCIINYL